jgi:hypothetical protein
VQCDCHAAPATDRPILRAASRERARSPSEGATEDLATVQIADNQPRPQKFSTASFGQGPCSLLDRNDKATTGAFSPFGRATTPGQKVPGRVPCSGAILRVRPEGGKVELVAWGLRNPFGLAFSPSGELFVTDNSYDERGSRPIWGTGDLLIHDQTGHMVRLARFPRPSHAVTETIHDSPDKPRPKVRGGEASECSPEAGRAAGRSCLA